jgi:hypothetical protein
MSRCIWGRCVEGHESEVIVVLDIWSVVGNMDHVEDPILDHVRISLIM